MRQLGHHRRHSGDCPDQAGYATTDGVVAFAGAIAEGDSAQVSILPRAGAVLLGRRAPRVG